ncbi:alpha-amylase family glycosyl hydrolase [Cryobacterium sp. Y82]|uniref:alpha-amylase family glycosyl hydrolase n=1 Tax=Cryobacterium sp. Y82 TaxID=2045017 RepID=UPI000CE47A5E|nr:alpha-amylase family glycosyl hydrolase [Cryobacterium sp. Y82]
MTDVRTQPWWTTAVIYEVYPRSFSDSTGDGVGDLRGITARLDYIADLGVQGIWLTPFQTSPQVDQGYDISDYCNVDPLFGTMDDFDELLAQAHARGIRLLVDIVPNHTSTEHPLFQEALASESGSEARQMFHFAEGPRGSLDDGLVPPNNWISVFGGSAWARAHPESLNDRAWFLHLFSSGQPDWNWQNPAVADYFIGVLRFWFDRGVDGIRIDVAHGLFKAEGLPDTETVPTVIDGLRSNPLAMDQEPVHEVYRRWRALADSYDEPRLLVGEVNLEPERAGRYTRPDELHQTFAFAFARLGWNPAEWVSVGQQFEQVRLATGAEPSWALENHDLVRTVTRFGGGVLGAARARAGLVALLGLPGATYIYQGQELGLPEVEVPESLRVDPMWNRGGISRDGARIPLPWQADATDSHAFSPKNAEAPPWLPIPEGWGQWAVSGQQRDAGSVHSAFTGAMQLRAALLASGVFRANESATWSLDADGLVQCSRAGGVTVVIAMGDSPVPVPAGRVLISSAPVRAGGFMPPDSAAWILPTP